VFKPGQTFTLPRAMARPHNWEVREAVVLEVVGEWVLIQASGSTEPSKTPPLWFRPASHPYLYPIN